ncbi:MAG TPA: HAMP domain-containing sensor histidine kinase [Bacteroidia bacterium]|nr:HAMP domain-containing sensor histidine kinase [Bacteroidia bacterium]
MKLLTRTNIYFLILTLLVFSLGGEVFYKRLHAINKADADERLEQEKERVLSYVKINQALPHNAVLLGDSVAFLLVSSTKEEKIGHLKTYNQAEKEYETYQTITFNVTIANQAYQAIIYRPLLESDDLTAGIAEAIAIIACCLIIVLLVSNFIISKIVWLPFYKTLEKIKVFDLIKENRIEFDKTNTIEFKALNDVLKSMTGKIVSDYSSLRKFTENASHELQTPLAIIQTKLELLIQSENLSENQIADIKTVYDSAGRLSRLNQALLLLAKIENKQFAKTQTVELNELIERKIEAFDELLKHKNISVEKQLLPVSLKMHPALADMLINNLIGNAIKHNVNGGRLTIGLTEKSLSIENTGNPLTTLPEDLFQRFRKDNNTSDSLGLGLAIVKEICQEYGFQIDYKYADNMHTINVRF